VTRQKDCVSCGVHALINALTVAEAAVQHGTIPGALNYGDFVREHSTGHLTAARYSMLQTALRMVLKEPSPILQHTPVLQEWVKRELRKCGPLLSATKKLLNVYDKPLYSLIVKVFSLG
jgi:hypothetical protein